MINILKYCKRGPFPIIIYSNWINNGITPMKRLLEMNNLNCYAYTGELNDKEKKRIVDEYNKETIQVLLLSSSGSEGLDLKNTRQIHIMEPHFNMAKINQVIVEVLDINHIQIYLFKEKKGSCHVGQNLIFRIQKKNKSFKNDV